MRALLSVYDKTGLVEFGRGLADLGYELVSTGGTLGALHAAGVPATAVADVTGFPEILDGRVKTLHPAIHAGLLARRDDADHAAQLLAHRIEPIGLVAANLYPFAAAVADPGVGLAKALEQVDIGGPAMIRAAAKNLLGVVVVTDPAEYGAVLDELRAGGPDPARRQALAARAFAHVSGYDAVVAEFLRGPDAAGLPDEITIAGRKARELRYGENPHQRAAAYRRYGVGVAPRGVLDAVQLGGKELSYNNLLDADAAWGAVAERSEPTVAIVKHTIPCGLATRARLDEAFGAALGGDPVSAFGGIVALNRRVDAETAAALAEVFFEVVIAPGFNPAAREALGRKRNLRLLEMPGIEPGVGSAPAWSVRPIGGGLLVQESDGVADDATGWRVVSRRAPSADEWDDLRDAWAAVRRVASNAIVLVRGRAVVGVGAGQPNRLASVRIAVAQAGERAIGSVLASDAFFPFADGLDAAAVAGVRAVVQPGGSVRDAEVIAAADAAGMAMVMTGVRHFRH